MTYRGFLRTPLNDHAGSDGAMGILVDDDKTPRGAVARVAVNDKGLLCFDIDSGNVEFALQRLQVSHRRGG